MTRVVRALTLAWGLTFAHAIALAQVGGQTGAESRVEVDATSVERQPSAAESFDAAEQARREGRLADAERALRRSLAADPRPETAFNLGAVLADLGRHREALEVFEDLGSGAFGALAPERLRIVRARLEASLASLARVRVRVESTRPVDLRVDGALRGELSSSGMLTLDLDPGTRRVSIEAGEWSVERVIELDAGETTSLSFRVPSTSLIERSPRRRRLAWGLAASVVAVAAALTIGLAARDPGVDRVDDPVWGRVWTLGGAR